MHENILRDVLITLSLLSGLSFAQTHQHNHDHAHDDAHSEPVARPRIFLDKSLRIVEYQLNRLDNERLLLVERSTDDPKYAPVYTAILTRAGMSPQYREEALHGLVQLKESDAVTELLAALESLDADDRQEQRTGRQLSRMLLRQPRQALLDKTELLEAATGSDSGLLRAIGHASLVTAGKPETAWSRAMSGESSALDWLAAVPLVPTPKIRSSLRDGIVQLLDKSQPAKSRQAAIEAIAFVPAGQRETFALLAPLVSQDEYRNATVRTLLRIEQADRDPQVSAQLADVLVNFAEVTPAAQRTTNSFLDAMQLTDQLLAAIPVKAARSYRERLREITVRVIQIHTVEEEMRYDVGHFAVEAGRPVQIVLKNEDLMPHNLVLTVPDALKEIAEEGAILGPNPGFEGKPYVPLSAKVLFATDMVQPGKQERLTFTAPSEPGEYPYVCTFPRHWMRMYGVMVVVQDLDDWVKNPTTPKDPIGSNRFFVQSWTVEDLQDELEQGLRGRTPEIGQRIFQEATCAQCHKTKGQGGAVGPELTGVLQRWKGDRVAMLREILDPSHRIDPKYAVQLIATIDGKVISGIVKSENSSSISILANPESPEPTVVQRSDIDEMEKTSKSMMPKALLDRFTKDEIFELLAFLEGLDAEQ